MLRQYKQKFRVGIENAKHRRLYCISIELKNKSQLTENHKDSVFFLCSIVEI